MKNWTLTNEERVFKTPRMEGVKVTYVAEDGESFTHTIIKSQPSVSVIVRSEDGKIAFIRQMRSTTGEYYMEIPAGLQNADEDNILEAAKREVREETGFLVKDVKILVKGPSLLDPSKSNEDYGVALATAESRESRCLDENEQIDEEIIWMDEKEVFQRLHHQMTTGDPFFKGLFLSGHTMYALLSYQFLK